MRALIVDDEKIVRSLIKTYLAKEGYVADEAENGQVAIEKLLKGHYDFVLLDIVMPVMDGLETLIYIRERSNVPVIMLSGAFTESDIEHMKLYCADDRILKPFSPTELALKIKTTLRSRHSDKQNEAIIETGPFIINEVRRTMFADAQPIRLTEKEFDMLIFMVKNETKQFDHEQLYNAVWNGVSNDAEEIVREYVLNIRTKLGKYKKALFRLDKNCYMFDSRKGKTL